MNSTRLDAAVDLLAQVARLQLERLHHLWRDDGAAGDVDRLVAGIGATIPRDLVDADPRIDMARTAFTDARPDALTRLADVAGLTSGDELLVAAVHAGVTDPQFATVLGCLHDDGARRYMTCALARRLLGPLGIDPPPAFDAGHPLVAHGIVVQACQPDERVELTPTATALLSGCRPGVVLSAPPPPARHHELCRRLTDHVEHADAPVLVRGPLGTGRRAVAVEAIIGARRTPVALARPLVEVALAARCSDVVPVVVLTDDTGPWPAHAGPVVAVGTPDARPPVPGTLVVDLPPPDHSERTAAWRDALADLDLPAPDDVGGALASRFAFTDGDVTAVAAAVRRRAAWEQRPATVDDVWAAARAQPQHSLSTVATLIHPSFDLDDLVLPDDVRSQLDELVAHVRQDHVVMEAWGFRARLPRGHGIAGLFTGPPGTGKTTAAEAVAAALAQDLYRIDLSRVVSKYIGETEKNLAVAFAEAERAGAVLFFDEADALFGRRTEVRDAHDRYANLEINYLLQRVESFSGLVLLASNRREAMDDAFLRRLRFVVPFDPPDRARRRELWRRAFPARTPAAPLDWDRLATLELTGGDINAAALRAAFLAASDGGCVTPAILRTALQREFARFGRAWPGVELEAGTP
jgi:hypothetical protein